MNGTNGTATKLIWWILGISVVIIAGLVTTLISQQSAHVAQLERRLDLLETDRRLVGETLATTRLRLDMFDQQRSSIDARLSRIEEQLGRVLGLIQRGPSTPPGGGFP